MLNPQKTIITCLFSALIINVQAQNLPNKQEISIFAPVNIKIDGKATEWNNQFQAYNHATGVFYTMANDKQNLYLTIYVTDASSIFNKIMTGGLTLVVQTPKQKASITYPFFAKGNLPSFKRKSKNNDAPVSALQQEKFDDTIMQYNNAVLAIKAKEIMTIGIKQLDTLISVYNEDGVKVAGLFDKRCGYTYELSVPLKYLGISDKNEQKLTYHIALNGGPSKYNVGMASVTWGTNPDGTPLSQGELQDMENAMNASRMAKYATTDFSGEYTLAKSPNFN